MRAVVFDAVVNAAVTKVCDANISIHKFSIIGTQTFIRFALNFTAFRRLNK